MEHLIRFDTGVEPLLQWDEQIQLVCGQVETILDQAAAAGLK